LHGLSTICPQSQQVDTVDNSKNCGKPRVINKFPTGLLVITCNPQVASKFATALQTAAPSGKAPKNGQKRQFSTVSTGHNNNADIYIIYFYIIIKAAKLSKSFSKADKRAAK